MQHRSRSTTTPRTIRFGVFEVDCDTAELRKHGLKIMLQDKPFQLLTALLEHPGQVVTRDELRTRLWGDHTFVDFERSLNIAIAKLRAALGDSADTPRFVETLPRRGYRFIAPIEPPTGAHVGAPLQIPRAQIKRTHLLFMVLTGLGILAIGLTLGWLYHRPHHPAQQAHIQTLAVLPLENLSGDAEQEYFADGMTDELINELAKISALRVISRTSTAQYRSVKKPLTQIAKELNVDAVLEGTVVRSGNRVRISAQLIEAPTDLHLWANSYERDLRDVVSLQDEVARAIANEIKIKVTPQEQVWLASAHPVNPEAYEAYLRGRYFWNKRTEDGLKKGIEYFRQAIEKDPTYGLAYSGLADSYGVLGNFDMLPPKEAYPKARAAATKALEVDDTLAEAHTSLAWVRFKFDWDWTGADGEFKRAIALNPSYAQAHHWYSLYLIAMGRTQESLAQIRQAQHLDPLSLIIDANIGWILYHARQYKEAIEQCQKTLEMDPNFPNAHWYLGWAYAQMQMYDAAIAEDQKLISFSAGNPVPTYLALLGYAYAVGGKRDRAREVIAQLQKVRERRHVPPYQIALIYMGLGQKNHALVWLEKAFEERTSPLTLLKVDPKLDPLRPDPRFKDLIRRIGLPQ